MSDYFLNPGKEGIAKFFDRIYTLIEQVSEGLDNTELNWRPSPKSNTIGILLKHIAVGEVILVHEVTGGKERPHDRPDEFEMDSFQIENLQEELAQVQTTTKKVLAELTEEQMTEARPIFARTLGREIQINVHWALMHAIEHAAQHIGQIFYIRKMYAEQ